MRESAEWASAGWAKLSAGDVDGAMAAFGEAARMDPGNRQARAGIVAGLRAQRPMYGMLLAGLFWLGGVGQRARWTFIIGGSAALTMVRRAGEGHAGLRMLVTVLGVAYMAGFMLLWLAGPLFTLTLRLSRAGRLVLTADQMAASNWVGGLLVLAAAAVAGGIISAIRTGVGRVALVGVLCLVLLIPVSAVFECPRGWRRGVVAAVTALAGLSGLALVWLLWAFGDTPLGAWIKAGTPLRVWLMEPARLVVVVFLASLVAAPWLSGAMVHGVVSGKRQER